jgi:hypothetical protein
MRLERGPYGGWKDAAHLTNGDAELVVPLEVGPRVLVYRLRGGPNVFKEWPDQLGRSGEPSWIPRGGHRLWTSPEDLTRCYAPDNGPIRCEAADAGVRFVQPPDLAHGVQKEITLTLAPSGSRVTVEHRITNVGDRIVTLACWSLTVMAPGGTEIIPLPPKRPHPGPPENAASAAEYAPNQHIVLWPFFDFTDARWQFGSRFILLRQRPLPTPTKIGLLHTGGWVAYHVVGHLFVKRVAMEPGAAYPDRGCNLETFTNADMLEIETLGGMRDLQPGQCAEHAETWELHPLAADLRTEDDVARHVLPLVGAVG